MKNDNISSNNRVSLLLEQAEKNIEDGVFDKAYILCDKILDVKGVDFDMNINTAYYLSYFYLAKICLLELQNPDYINENIELVNLINNNKQVATYQNGVDFIIRTFLEHCEGAIAQCELMRENALINIREGTMIS